MRFARFTSAALVLVCSFVWAQQPAQPGPIDRIKITDNVPADTLLMYENWFGKGNKFNVNNLVDDTSSDMGKYATGSPGVAIHDQFADIEKIAA